MQNLLTNMTGVMGSGLPQGPVVPTAGPLRTLMARLGDLRKASPGMFWFVSAVYTVLLAFAFWIPTNDFDAMSSYLCRIKLEEFGPIRQSATMEIQYLFPKFFDYLHAPFLNIGYFHAFPNFALFTGVLAVAVCGFNRQLAARWIIGLMAAAPVLVGVTSVKNDVSLAFFAFLAWYAIYYARASASWYPAVCLLAICSLVGTKWHGFFLAPPFFLCLVWKLYQSRATLTRRAGLVTLLALPLFWWVSSAGTYIDNLRYEGKLCPTPDYLVTEKPTFWKNAAGFAINNVLETAEVPLYYADYKTMHGTLWTKLQKWSLGSKAYTYAIAPHSHIAAYGMPMLIVVGACLVALFRRSTPGPIRMSAAIALLYLIACLLTFKYSTWINRYFLVTYVLGLMPLAHLTVAWYPRRIVRWAIAGWVVFVCYQCVFWNMEKPLVKRNMFYASDNHRYEKPSIFPSLKERDRLYFVVWAGHIHIFNFMKANIHDQDQLLIINRYQGNNVPFLYPLIKDRTPANTVIINDRFGQEPPAGFEDRFEYVMVHNGGLWNPRYVPMYQEADVIFYRRVPKPAE